MLVRTMETLAGGEWTVRQPVVRVPALTAAHSVLGHIATAVEQGAQVEILGR